MEHYNRSLKNRRSQLRNNATSAEATLWKYLQKKQLEGRKFRRQHSIDSFIVDFYCDKERLVVELDGAYHLDFAGQHYDQDRTEKLEKLGYRVVRFENKYVFDDIEFVLKEISDCFGK